MQNLANALQIFKMTPFALYSTFYFLWSAQFAILDYTTRKLSNFSHHSLNILWAETMNTPRLNNDINVKKLVISVMKNFKKDSHVCWSIFCNYLLWVFILGVEIAHLLRRDSYYSGVKLAPHINL